MIHPFIYLQKMRYGKVKIQQFLSDPRIHSVLPLFQKVFQNTMKFRQCHRKRREQLHNLPFPITQPLQMQQLSVTFIQLPDHSVIDPFYEMFACQKVFFPERSAVHLPPPLHKVVSFIDQKQIFSLYALAKKPLQIYMRIENVVIITNDSVAEQTDIQSHFKRTDLITSGIVYDHFPGKIDFMG